MRFGTLIMVCLLAGCNITSHANTVIASPSTETETVKQKDTMEAGYSLSFTQVSLADAVRGISRSYGLNIMGIDTLRGTVTARFQGVSPKDLLMQLGDMYHFTVTEHDGIIRVLGDGGDKDRRNTVVVEPEYIAPGSLAEALHGIVPADKLGIAKDTNQIVMSLTDRERRNVTEVMRAVDREPRQVRLEATVMAMEQSYVKETGFRWSWLSLTGHGEDQTHTFGALSYGKAPSGGAYKFFVKPELSLMENSGKAVIIARPSIMTMNGEKANILIGERIPVWEEFIQDGERKSTVRYEDVGIKLDYTPIINKNGVIDAVIHAEVSVPTLVSEVKAYKITTRQAHTRVRLKSGEVLVIGGLMDNRNQKQLQKIPILGDIPLLGKLFRHSRKTKDSVEMVIFVRATVV